MIGRKFGLVTVLRRAVPYIDGAPDYYCLCECGRARLIYKQQLLRQPPKTHATCYKAEKYPIDSKA